MSNRKIEISPSVLGADLMRLGEEIRMVEALGIHWLHLDDEPDYKQAVAEISEILVESGISV